MSLQSRSRRLAQKRFWEKHDPDEYQCPDCNRTLDEIPSDSFEVHHEDGNAFNNSMENLVGLCPLCHNIREGKRPGSDSAKALRDALVAACADTLTGQEGRSKAEDGAVVSRDEAAEGCGHKTTFEKAAAVTTRDQKGSIVIPVEPAVNQSGNAGGDGIRFSRSDEPVLTGEVIDEKPDGRKHKLARAINRFGAGETKSVAIPSAGLEHLGIDRSAAADGVDLELWVCSDPKEDRHLIAVTPVIHQEMQFRTPERESE